MEFSIKNEIKEEIEEFVSVEEKSELENSVSTKEDIFSSILNAEDSDHFKYLLGSSFKKEINVDKEEIGEFVAVCEENGDKTSGTHTKNALHFESSSPTCNLNSNVTCNYFISHNHHHSSAVQNPWPHLNDFYLINSREGDKLIFKCKLCLPKAVAIKGHMTSLNNLKQHIKRTHPSEYERFEEKVKAGSGRGKTKKRFLSGSNSGSNTLESSNLFLPPSRKKARQHTTAESFDIAATGSGIPQAAVDQRIADFFVTNMLPLHVVESNSFERLIKTLNPSKSSMSRRTLGRHIVGLHTNLKQYLVRVLGDVKWVATTVDCWSVHKKFYLGMTAHWLDSLTRQRQKAVLACIRLRGYHTYDVLAQAIVNIHSNFHIENKVTRITTDNGNSIVKAFVQFGAEAELTPDLPVSEGQNVDINSDDAAAATEAPQLLLGESVNDQELEYVSVEDSLAVHVAELDDADIVVDNPINLPAHMRCAAHTLNLVATEDADAALQSPVFKRSYRFAMVKARAIWKQQHRSPVAADSIYSELGRRLVVPNTTRWISTYDSVVVLNTILETNRPVLHRVMTHLKVNTFNDQDINFMKEYAQVMSPVAKALDKIQGEEQAYLGTLLPIFVETIFRLKAVKSKGLIYCNPLVDALLAGIDKRFRTFLGDEECLLATAFHPKFRLIWLEKYDNTKVAKLRATMEDKVEEAMRQHSDSSNNSRSSTDEEEDDFFIGVTQPNDISMTNSSMKSKAQHLVKIWLETNSKDMLTDAAFFGEPVLLDLFIRYNTPIPSSVAVEHFFSMGKDILRAKRSYLSDEIFEILIFVKGNMHLLNEMEGEMKKKIK